MPSPKRFSDGLKVNFYSLSLGNRPDTVSVRSRPPNARKICLPIRKYFYYSLRVARLFYLAKLLNYNFAHQNEHIRRVVCSDKNRPIKWYNEASRGLFDRQRVTTVVKRSVLAYRPFLTLRLLQYFVYEQQMGAYLLVDIRRRLVGVWSQSVTNCHQPPANILYRNLKSSLMLTRERVLYVQKFLSVQRPDKRRIYRNYVSAVGWCK